jgi:hypothetical protein
MATFDLLIGQQRRQESSIHAGVINKPWQDSKRTVTSGPLCVITGPIDSALDLVLSLIAGDGQTNFLHLNTLDYKKCDETLRDEYSQDTYFEGWKKLKRLLKNPRTNFRAVERGGGHGERKDKPGDKAGWVHGGYARAPACAPRKTARAFSGIEGDLAGDRPAPGGILADSREFARRRAGGGIGPRARIRAVGEPSRPFLHRSIPRSKGPAQFGKARL